MKKSINYPSIRIELKCFLFPSWTVARNAILFPSIKKKKKQNIVMAVRSNGSYIMPWTNNIDPPIFSSLDAWHVHQRLSVRSCHRSSVLTAPTTDHLASRRVIKLKIWINACPSDILCDNALSWHRQIKVGTRLWTKIHENHVVQLENVFDIFTQTFIIIFHSNRITKLSTPGNVY